PICASSAPANPRPAWWAPRRSRASPRRPRREPRSFTSFSPSNSADHRPPPRSRGGPSAGRRKLRSLRPILRRPGGHRRRARKRTQSVRPDPILLFRDWLPFPFTDPQDRLYGELGGAYMELRFARPRKRGLGRIPEPQHFMRIEEIIDNF